MLQALLPCLGGVQSRCGRRRTACECLAVHAAWSSGGGRGQISLVGQAMLVNWLACIGSAVHLQVPQQGQTPMSNPSWQSKPACACPGLSHLHPLLQAALVDIAQRALAIARRQQHAAILAVGFLPAHTAGWLRRCLSGGRGRRVVGVIGGSGRPKRRSCRSCKAQRGICASR